MTTRPLGVFDSGLGGLTVVRALRRRLPNEPIVYLGDTARVPYGNRSPDTVLRYARACAKKLTERDIKALVVACNTVSAVALDMLRAELDLPVIGVVEPGARAAIRLAEELARNGDARAMRIGVLGTASTIASGAYTRAVGRLSTRFEVIGRAAPLLVPLVEEGWIDGAVPRLAVERYIAPLVEQEVGVVVLGCTHYPVLRTLIVDVLDALAHGRVGVVDSADATAQGVEELLSDRDLVHEGPRANSLELLVTDIPASFSAMAERCLDEPPPRVEQVDL